MRCKLKSINTEYFLSQQIWIRTESLYHKQNQTSNANTNQTTEKNAKKPFNLLVETINSISKDLENEAANMKPDH
jgi:hypothetical protein